MTPTITHEDEGKPVVDANGERIATVERVDDGTALVDPRTEIGPATTRALGWTDDDRDLRPLREHAVERVTGDAVRLRSNL